MRAYVQVPFVAVRKGQTNSSCPFLFFEFSNVFLAIKNHIVLRKRTKVSNDVKYGK